MEELPIEPLPRGDQPVIPEVVRVPVAAVKEVKTTKEPALQPVSQTPVGLKTSESKTYFIFPEYFFTAIAYFFGIHWLTRCKKGGDNKSMLDIYTWLIRF